MVVVCVVPMLMLLRRFERDYDDLEKSRRRQSALHDYNEWQKAQKLILGVEAETTYTTRKAYLPRVHTQWRDYGGAFTHETVDKKGGV
jgi:hypothetical protein